jgi:MFS transporter, ACDE family, multidrug resistance protein
MGAHALGAVFFGWGLLLAFTSVFVAPRLKRRFGVVATLGAMYAALAAILAAMGFGEGTPALLAVMVIVAGGVLGVVNTVLTEAVMRIAPVERPIASSAYSFVRFAGGAIAPWLAGKLAEWVAPDTPFFVGAAAVVVALAVLLAGRAYFAETGEVEAADEAALPAPVLVAVDGSTRGIAVTAAAARLAAERGAAVQVLHVHETDVVGDDAVDRESREVAAAVLAGRLAQLRAAGVEAGGEVVHTFGDREDAVQAVLDRSDELGAQVIVVGRQGRVAARATVPVVVVPA